MSLREGFLSSMKPALGQGRAGVECTAGVSLKTSGEGLLGLFGGGEYRES